MTVPVKKYYTGKRFDFGIFGLKYVLKHSESIPTKKSYFGQKILTLWSFYNFGHFLLNEWNASRLVGQACKPELALAFGESQEKNCKRKDFDFDIFSLKYVLNYSESIPTKKFWLRHFFFYFFHFLEIIKTHFLTILGEK